jgi:hypothetical protein
LSPVDVASGKAPYTFPASSDNQVLCPLDVGYSNIQKLTLGPSVIGGTQTISARFGEQLSTLIKILNRILSLAI